MERSNLGFTRNAISCLLLSAAIGTWQANASPAMLPQMGADTQGTSVSGLSSGAFMAVQYHVAFSAETIGAGVVAGGPWNCVNGDSSLLPTLTKALQNCMYLSNGGKVPPTRAFLDLSKRAEKKGEIDPTSNLSKDRVYVFTGIDDKTVKPPVVVGTKELYLAFGVNEQSMQFVQDLPAGHAFITDLPDNEVNDQCEITQSPYINYCEQDDYYQAQALLDHIYQQTNPPSESPQGELIAFDQFEFVKDSDLARDKSSFSETGYVYVPPSCQQSAENCSIHVVFHGCKQGVEYSDLQNGTFGMKYIEHTGYRRMADTNQLIMLYPQVKARAGSNPNGCWDWWGYTGNHKSFYRKDAVQLQAVNQMVKRLQESVELASQ